MILFYEFIVMMIREVTLISAMADKTPKADENLITFTSILIITNLNGVHHDNPMMAFDRAAITFKIVDQLLF